MYIFTNQTFNCVLHICFLYTILSNACYLFPVLLSLFCMFFSSIQWPYACSSSLFYLMKCIYFVLGIKEGKFIFFVLQSVLEVFFMHLNTRSFIFVKHMQCMFIFSMFSIKRMFFFSMQFIKECVIFISVLSSACFFLCAAWLNAYTLKRLFCYRVSK